MAQWLGIERQNRPKNRPFCLEFGLLQIWLGIIKQFAVKLRENESCISGDAIYGGHANKADRITSNR
ncbi:hypothetical protein GCM10007879_17730 [Maritalea porphyrae]|uniref:Transposase n=1 Tax=Maritalea porphyrae TaxID=880732 RepID=A0ABQ5UQL6_9HYPH|nr:hypothetical protein GCM10007879_17730 [Maritalea porphyrae]